MVDMSQRIEAIFDNGVFRPDGPVNIPEGQRVSLTIDSASASGDELNELRELLDADFMEFCRQHAASAPSLKEVSKLLNGFDGSLAGRIVQERDER
jgi:predicted DNA-binding antitoxin AbrB/MazE fold protein